MANTTLTADIILKEAQRLFKNNTPFLQGMSRQYDGTYEAMGAKSGENVRIRKPMKYKVRTGKTVQVQDNIENFVTLKKTTQKGIDLKFSSAELTQDINRFSELYIKPAINVLASDIEVDIYEQAINGTFNQVGTEGSGSVAFKNFTDADAKMTDFSTPGGYDRSVILNPNAMSSIADSLKSLFQAERNIRDQYLTGQVMTAAGLEFANTPNVTGHTSGASDGAYLVNGAGQTGTSITVDTGTGGYNKGDIVTFAGVNAVNPTTKADLGFLQQFVLTADFPNGATVMQILPELISDSTSSQQTVTASPANNAAVNSASGFVAGASNRFNLAYHKLAYAFATVDLEMPDSIPTAAKSREVVDGVSMRLINFFDGINDDNVWRLDILYGFEPVTPEWACRVAI